MVFQSYALFPHLTVRENILFGVRVRKEPAKHFEARLKRVSDILGLDHLLMRRPGQLSGGQQQRVSIARALMNGGDIILADEPTGALDTETGEEILRMLRARCDAGAAGVLVTHEARHAAWADRVVFLRDGVVVDESGSAPVDDLLEVGHR